MGQRTFKERKESVTEKARQRAIQRETKIDSETGRVG